MNRRAFLSSLGALAAPVLAQSKPNLILIIADDLGYAGISAQGCDIPTPHIDSIARSGVRFTNGYVSCPVCSPTRAGIITGRYQQRFGHEFNPGPAGEADTVFGLSTDEAALPERLKKLGYATGMVGKWHLGYRRDSLPLQRGFDEFFGFPGGAHSYVADDRQGNPVMRGNDPVKESGYLTDAFAREAVAFIKKNKDRPYYLYLPFNAVHAPMEALNNYKARFPKITDELRLIHAGMLSAMDDAVGAVLKTVRDAGQESNTLIVFISDNGGPTQQTTSSNKPLRGVKGQVYDGGIRVPYMMQWNGKIRAGAVYDQPVIALDIHPTFVTAAGGSLPPNLDGVDLMPYVTGKNRDAPHSALYWRFGQQWAIRMGDWKLLGQGGDPELYNLRNDIGESRNLASSEPGKLKELQSAWQSWSAQMQPPKWSRAGDGKKGGGKKRKKKQ